MKNLLFFSQLLDPTCSETASVVLLTTWVAQLPQEAHDEPSCFSSDIFVSVERRIFSLVSLFSLLSLFFLSLKKTVQPCHGIMLIPPRGKFISVKFFKIYFLLLVNDTFKAEFTHFMSRIFYVTLSDAVCPTILISDSSTRIFS